jgi:hypothetical protein
MKYFVNLSAINKIRMAGTKSKIPIELYPCEFFRSIKLAMIPIIENIIAIRHGENK